MHTPIRPSGKKGRVPWHSETGQRREIFRSKALGRLGETIPYTGENMVALVIGAALLVVALLSVMRTSELKRLKVGCVERDSDDPFAPWLIRGRLSKSSRGHVWVVVPEVKAAIAAHPSCDGPPED